MNNPYASSLETQVLSATPMELVAMLYDGALTAVREARQHLAEGRIFERGRQVTKAVAILAELAHSLDREKGGDLTVRLAGLYDFMQKTLLDANFQQTDEGFEIVENLLKTLAEAWAEVARGASTPEYAMPPVAAEYAAVRQQWSA